MSTNLEEELRECGFLRISRKHGPSTVRRRLANWSIPTPWRGPEGAFSSPAIKSAIRVAIRAINRPAIRTSGNAIHAIVKQRA
jgi:hypothetical protein